MPAAGAGFEPINASDTGFASHIKPQNPYPQTGAPEVYQIGSYQKLDYATDENGFIITGDVCKNKILHAMYTSSDGAYGLFKREGVVYPGMELDIYNDVLAALSVIPEIEIKKLSVEIVGGKANVSMTYFDKINGVLNAI
jgi:hypothetical protein